MESAQQHCLYLKDIIKNSNDSDAIQPHKTRIDTENYEKVYKVAYMIPDWRMFQWMHHWYDSKPNPSHDQLT